MTEQQEWTFLPADKVAPQEIRDDGAPSPAPAVATPPPVEEQATASQDAHATECDGNRAECRHVRAGRKGAHRVHQLIEEGRLYEQEHGLKRGRQRLRQLIDLGKLYEQEHGLRPAMPKNSGRRLSRRERQELVATFLQCLQRMVKPSFRDELARALEAMREKESGHLS